MNKFEIGQKVNVNPMKLPGVVVSVDSESYHVEVTKENGTTSRHVFIHEELTVIEDESGTVEKAAEEPKPGALVPEKTDASGKITDVKTGETTDNNGGVKDVAGESSTSGPAAVSGEAATPSAAASTAATGDAGNPANTADNAGASVAQSKPLSTDTASGDAGNGGAAGESSADTTGKAAPVSDAKASGDATSATLVGSSTQPASFTLADGTVLSLGDVVAKAQTSSGLSVDDWNAQLPADREAHIQLEVDTLELKEPDAAEKQVIDQNADAAKSTVDEAAKENA